MHVVAITRLGTSIDAEAATLAAATATPVATVRARLAALPAIVLERTDEDRAAALVAELRRRGHDAAACDTDDVVAARDMTVVRHFRLDPDALVLTADVGDTELPWSDVVALIRATHRTVSKSVQQVNERQFAPGRALLTGGLSMSKTVKREVESQSDTTEPVLYIFRRSGPPWLLGRDRANYGALGKQLQPSAAANFTAAVERLRALATRAKADDRLAPRRTATDELDLLAHLLAHALGPAW